MNKRKFYSLLITVVNLLFVASLCFSQNQHYEDIWGGTEFWIGLPMCGRETNEAIRGDYPIAIWITSNIDTRAKIGDAESGTSLSVVIRKNQITQVPYGDFVMNKISEQPNNYGIFVKSDAPVSVCVYMSYKWSGEAFKVLPVNALGKKYVSVNLYQDQLLTSGEYRPGQILIVATEDGTRLTYRPTVETAKGVKPGVIGSANLNKGQTFLILAKIQPNNSQYVSTDMTGTIIESDKPIYVVSGHTKVAYPRYQYTFLGRNGGFMRNMMVDCLIPVEMLGTEYISAPLKYADRPRGKIADDAGDLIRFVVTEDNTTIYMIKEEGTGLQKISPVLKKGQYYDIVNQESPAYYKSDKKILATQFGKTWWIYPTSPETNKGEDLPDNPARNGQGMLMTLIPKDRWVSYACWRSPAEIDDFIYITFDKKYLNYLYCDDRKITEKFGNSIKYIPGTEYAYVTDFLAAGDHMLRGDAIPGTNGSDIARFAVYAYGNWDRSKDGFAYGYPVGMDYSTSCNDSLSIIDSSFCGNITAFVDVIPQTEPCAMINNIFATDESNYWLQIDSSFKPGSSKTVGYNLRIINPNIAAKAVVKIQTASGLTKAKTYEYIPEEIKFSSMLIDFGRLKLGDSICKTIDIINTSKLKDATINRLYLKEAKPEFKINYQSSQYPLTVPFTLKPGEKKTVEVCVIASVNEYNIIRDYLKTDLSCNVWPAAELLYYGTGEPVAYIDDAQWSFIHVGDLAVKIVKITNRGNIPLELYSVNWPDSDKINFPKVENLPCSPQGGTFTNTLTIQPASIYEFMAYYKPSTPGNHKTTLTFKANTTRDKLYSELVGSSYTNISEPTEEIKIIADEIIFLNNQYSQDIQIIDILGRNMKVEFITTGEYSVINISNLPQGLYLFKSGNMIRKFVKL